MANSQIINFNIIVILRIANVQKLILIVYNDIDSFKYDLNVV